MASSIRSLDLVNSVSPEPLIESAKTNLVIPGGGIIGRVYFEGIRVLMNAGHRFNAISGSSAGAVVATVATMASESQINDTEFWDDIRKVIFEILNATNYTTDLGDLFMGTMHSVQSLKSNIRKLLEYFCPEDPTISFKKAIDTGVLKKTLLISAYEMNERKIKYFSSDITPDVSILDAITASCCVFFFGTYSFIVNGKEHVFIDAVNIQDFPYSPFIRGGPVSGEDEVPFIEGDRTVVFIGINDTKSSFPIIDIMLTWRAEFYKTAIRTIKNLSIGKNVFMVDFFDSDGNIHNEIEFIETSKYSI